MTKSTRPIVRIHDLATEKIIDREMNDLEFEQYKADIEAEIIRKADLEARAAQRQTILNKFGLTSEEAALLLS